MGTKTRIDSWDPKQWESWSSLMAKVQSGDQEAYRQLLEEIGPLLYAYVRRRVYDPQFVGDVYQDLMLRFHKAHRSYETSRPFGPWLFAVARNSILNSLARRRRIVENEIPVEVLPENGSEEVDDGAHNQVFQALQALPEINRKAIELLKLEGLSLEEAAEQLQISVSALKARAHRGYLALRRDLWGKKR